MTLKDNEKIKDTHIKQNDILKLKLREKTYPWKIYVQYNTGDPVPVGVSQDETLNEVRARIFDQDVVLCDNAGKEYAYNASVDGNNINNGDFLYAQAEKAKKDIPNQENVVQRREANARHGRSRPATPPAPSRLKTPPSDGTFRRKGNRNPKSDDESDNENAPLQDLHAAITGVVQHAAGGAHEDANSTVSGRSKKSRAEVFDDLNAKLMKENEKKEKLAESIEKICRKLSIHVNKDSYSEDIEGQIDNLQAKSNKWGAFINRLDKLLLDDGEIRLDGEAESEIFTRVQNLKDFSIEIGQILQVVGDVDLSVYKQKARDIMDNEDRQKTSITQLKDEVTHLKAVLQEKEANISDLQETNNSLKSMEGMSEDLLKIQAQEAESKVLTYQQEVRKYERMTSEQQYEVDQLHGHVDELKSQMSQSKQILDAKLQKFAERVAHLVKQNEIDKNTLGKKLKSALEDFNEMSKNFDEERKKNTALRHENTTHQRQLQETDRKYNTLRSEKLQLNSTLTQIKGDLTETRRTIHTHEQTIATVNANLQQHEKELQRLQGVIREQERQDSIIATELQRLRNVEKAYIASSTSESDELKTVKDQIKTKDDDIRRITAELASTKRDLSRLNGDHQRLLKTADDEVKLIERLTQEQKDLLKEVERLNNRTSYVTGPARILPQTTFSLRTRSGQPPDDDDDDDDTYQYAPHDIDDHGDQASVHFAHLMARLRELVGEKPSVQIVSDLVNVFLYHVKNPKDQQALLKRIIPEYTPSRDSMEFGNYLYDYLLRHNSSSSVHHQLRRLYTEGVEV
jgi:hypothetical protein